jgi:phage shock protein A
MAQALVTQGSASEQTALALRSQISAIRAKQVEARSKLASLSSRLQIVESGRALRGRACRSSSGTDGFARFQKMRRQIEQAEAEAEFLVELEERVEWSLETEAESRERARARRGGA